VSVPHNRTSSNERLEILCKLLRAEKEVKYLNKDFDQGCPNKAQRGDHPNCGLEEGQLLEQWLLDSLINYVQDNNSIVMLSITYYIFKCN
jgi:hypothetical protein